MQIVCYVSFFVPVHNAGAEVMLYEMMLAMVNKGHKVTVISDDATINYYKCMDCIRTADIARVKKVVSQCDVVITHLINTQKAIKYAKRYNKPIVHILHNDKQIFKRQITNSNSDLIIANSQWIYDTIKLDTKKMIIHPAIDINKYEVQTNGEAIVLINLIKVKGAELFYQLAELMPEYKFIGVRGGYLVNRQIVPQDLPPNVEILPNTPNIQEVYKRAKIVLMPSEAESWGKVAIEACCSGIPVIANKTAGLTESLGNAGIFIDVNQPLLWVKKIKSLYRNQSFYTRRSNLCKKRAIELELIYKKQIEELNNNLEEIVRG